MFEFEQPAMCALSERPCFLVVSAPCLWMEALGKGGSEPAACGKWEVGSGKWEVGSGKWASPAAESGPTPNGAGAPPSRLSLWAAPVVASAPAAAASAAAAVLLLPLLLLLLLLLLPLLLLCCWWWW